MDKQVQDGFVSAVIWHERKRREMAASSISSPDGAGSAPAVQTVTAAAAPTDDGGFETGRIESNKR